MKRCLFTTIAYCVFLVACNKSKLDINPYPTQIIPQTVGDFQMLLDNQSYFNANRPFLGELGADAYYAPYDQWSSFSTLCRLSYVWAKDPFESSVVNDWTSCYGTVYNTNVILQGLEKLRDRSDLHSYEDAKGQALFHRGHSYWQLAQLFCKPYNKDSAAGQPGLPLRLEPDLVARVARGTLWKIYEQIIVDLQGAYNLLPEKSNYKTRPDKNAAAALLSRVYLSMADYDKALEYADKSLALDKTLTDYNSIVNGAVPFKQYNEEVIWHATMGSSVVFNIEQNCLVDTNLYMSYDNDDLRKQLYYNNSAGGIIFKGTYAGVLTSLKFAGIANDEIYFTRAECYARKGMLTQALQDLNAVMAARWKNNGSYKPFAAQTANVALDIILAERRKSLVFRGLRWSDLRRLNMDGRNIALKRILKDTNYVLEPNSPRYVYPIPDQEIALNPIEQNIR